MSADRLIVPLVASIFICGFRINFAQRNPLYLSCLSKFDQRCLALIRSLKLNIQGPKFGFLESYLEPLATNFARQHLLLACLLLLFETSNYRNSTHNLRYQHG